MSGSINAGGDFVLPSGIKSSVDDEWMPERLFGQSGTSLYQMSLEMQYKLT